MAVHYHIDGFPPAALDWPRLIPLIGPANAEVARYEGVLHAVPNSAVLLSPLTTQEAVLSSRIEGTQATFDEVLQFEAGAPATDQPPEKRADIQEVLNYRQALTEAVESLKTLPLSQRLVKLAHSTLMQGVRGQNRTPGEYRRIQNWIGPEGMPIESARFVPISPERINDAMSAWEAYAHAGPQDYLVQLAVLHAEFEAIHPFLDGNGRLGRMLVPLFLFERKLLSSPMFYVSAYLEAKRDEYYERLLAVSRDNDWTGWCEFFLRSIIDQAKANQLKARSILSLYDTKKGWIVDLTHSHHAIRALDWCFKRPVFQSSDFVAGAGIPPQTAKRILKLVREHGMLTVVREPSGRRAGIFAFPELLNVAEGKQVF